MRTFDLSSPSPEIAKAVSTSPRRGEVFRHPIVRLTPLFAICLFLAGGGLIAQALYMPAKAKVAQALLERAWADAKTGDGNAAPWPWADAKVFGVLTAPRLDARAVLLSEASGEAMAFAPGHMSATPRPGARGVSVLAAHRDTHFAFLKDLVPGDAVSVETAEGVFSYVVEGAEIVRWDASGLDPHAPGERLALVTCYPFNATHAGGPLRYVVYASRRPARPQPAPGVTKS
ncbi:MAG: class GN sortase [Pseudomonadota bacterium]